MTPKVQGIASALAKLHHNLDDRAEKLLTRIEKVDQRSDGAFKGAHARLDQSEVALADVEKLMNELEQSNGGPSLGDSQESSNESSSKEPRDSWAGDTPKAS